MISPLLESGQCLFDDIRLFNAMYKLDTPAAPDNLGTHRLAAFEDIIREEVKEVEELYATASNPDKTESELLSELADWLGDIVIYCLSEMLRWGLEPREVLKIIMQSNFSKLDADGKPIYDERGKILKGPNYWKPEPKLLAYIQKAKGEF